jgi:hypothetical protein
MAAVLYIFFIGFDSKMIEFIIVISILVVAIIIALVILVKRSINGVVKAIAILSVLIAVGAVAFSLLENDEDIIIRRISTFESAFNRGDLESMINCFDPLTRVILRTGARFGNAFFSGSDTRIADIFGLATGLVTLYDFDIPTISMTVLSTEVNGDRAVAYVVFDAGGYEYFSSIPLIKRNMGWHIDGFGLFD